MIGVVLLLVVLLSGFCYYGVRSETAAGEAMLRPWL